MELLLYTIIPAIIIALLAWALVDAIVRPAAAFTYADTLSKWSWVGVLGCAIAVRVGILPFRIPFEWILSFALLVAAFVYLGPVRDRLKNYPGKRSDRRERGSW